MPEGDVFVDRKNLGFALDGDTVAVKVISSEKTARRKSREGIVTKVVRRAADELAGTAAQARRQVYLYPRRDAEYEGFPDPRRASRQGTHKRLSLKSSGIRIKTIP